MQNKHRLMTLVTPQRRSSGSLQDGRRRIVVVSHPQGSKSTPSRSAVLALSPRVSQVLLIRAYNSRPKDQTVGEQFSQYRRVNANGDAVLTREVRSPASGVGSGLEDACTNRTSKRRWV